MKWEAPIDDTEDINLLSTFLEKKPNANEQNYMCICQLPVSCHRRSSCAVKVDWKATACEGSGLWACTAVRVTLLLCRSAWIWQHETICPTTLCSTVCERAAESRGASASSQWNFWVKHAWTPTANCCHFPKQIFVWHENILILNRSFFLLKQNTKTRW